MRQRCLISFSPKAKISSTREPVALGVLAVPARRGEDGDAVGKRLPQQLDHRRPVLLPAGVPLGEQFGEHLDAEADVALLVLGDVLHAGAEAGHRPFLGQEVLDEVLAGLGEAALDDQVVERDRLRVLGERAVLLQFLRHHVEAVEDAVVAPVQLRQGGGERLLEGVAADPDHLFEEAVEEDRVADLVDLLGGEEVGLLLGRRRGDVGGERVGDAVLAVEEHRVDPHRRAPLDLAEAVPALAVLGEVDVVSAPVAVLPALVEVLVADVVHQALGGDAHLISFWCCIPWPERSANLAGQPSVCGCGPSHRV